ncbi:MAG: GDSL-type esterase/lipase family protein [Bacilli bacterium]|nr:GDSL-type esterase/lipase family protein [Bacilli bacterium]MDD4808644.1 GDSL-type esterase/lipase family protein [Bacilli bacterium]
MKKLFILIIILGSVFLIYMTTVNKKSYYLSLGDSIAVGINAYGDRSYGYANQIRDYLKEKNNLDAYVSEFAKEGYRTTDLINDIKTNREIIIGDKPKTIQNALIKADIITVSIGLNDILYYLTVDSEQPYNKVNEIMTDIKELFKLLKEYSKEQIIVLGYYNPLPNHQHKEEIEDIIIYANQKLKILCNDYNIQYVDLYYLFEDNDYLVNPDNIHPSNEGYLAITNKIIALID